MQSGFGCVRQFSPWAPSLIGRRSVVTHDAEERAALRLDEPHMPAV
jgi:hypothetical protein